MRDEEEIGERAIRGGGCNNRQERIKVPPALSGCGYEGTLAPYLGCRKDTHLVTVTSHPLINSQPATVATS